LLFVSFFLCLPSDFHSPSLFHLLLASILKATSFYSPSSLNFTSSLFSSCLILSFTILPLYLPLLPYLRSSLL
jgi:hypothetical protein